MAMNWQLAHQDHAIERVSISFQFTEPLPSKLWQSMLSAAETGFQDLGFAGMPGEPGFVLPPPGIQGQPGFEIVIQGGNAVFGLPLGGQGGRTFRVTAGNEVTEEVSLTRARFAYTATIYEGWTRFRNRSQSLLGRYLDEALSMVGMNLIKMEYWDRFVFDGPPERADYEAILRSDSRHVPHFYSSTNELWHSHVGYFADPGSSQRRLVNVNVDVLDLLQRVEADTQAPNAPRRSVGIYSMVQDTLGAESAPAGGHACVSTLEEMHTILKGVLLDVINDEVAQRISLNAGVRP
jgi:uncharacterized protein (TIGR04255 family)